MAALALRTESGRGPLLARRVRATAAALVTAGALALSAGGCLGIFEPARPENPSSGSSGTIGNYTSPESCLHYMAAGIGLKNSAGQDIYLGALGDSVRSTDKVSFYANFHDVDWTSYIGLKPAFWTYDYERQFYGSLVALFPDPYELVWSEDPDNPHDQQSIPGYEVIAHRHYRIRALRQNDTLDVAVGYADLTFHYVAPRWWLVRWNDRVIQPAAGEPPIDRTVIQSMGARRLNAQIGG